MATLDTSTGVVGSATALTSANPSPEPSGSDRYMFAVACGYSADPTAVKYGGSGGTSLGQLGIDLTIGSFTATFWDVAPGPTGTTNAYGDFDAGNANAITAAFYTGTDQTTPGETLQTNSGNNGDFDASVLATITVTGVESGQEVVVGLAYGVQGGPTISSVVAGTDTTVVRSDFPATSGETQCGTAVLRGVAAGTSVTLSATVTVSATFGTLVWGVGARPLINAAGGASFQSAWARNSNQLIGA